MYGTLDDEKAPLQGHFVNRNRKTNWILGGLIAILLAALGVTTFNNYRIGQSVRHWNLAAEYQESTHPVGYLHVGDTCQAAEQCKACANESDTTHCSPKTEGGPDICWCKEHRLYPGETCLAAEECKPKTCVAKGEEAVCDGHPRVCKCKPKPEGKDTCLGDEDCPHCEAKNETSRCAGNPRVCKSCQFKYAEVGEGCTESSECLYCLNKEEKPQCSGEGDKKVCKCKPHRLHAGAQCLDREECKCENEAEIATCGGHPRVCQCMARHALKVGEKCERSQQCEDCADEKDRPHCVPEGSGGHHRICKCKLHRLYPGETCYSKEECKPKTCVEKGEVAVCHGHPRVCKCKPKPEGKETCLGGDECPHCEAKNETSRCSGHPKECKACQFRYLDIWEKCEEDKECLFCANKEDKEKCLEEKGEKRCRCKYPGGHSEHRLTKGMQCLEDEECKCDDEKEVNSCGGHPRVCKCHVKQVKRVGDKCARDEECKPCANEKDTPHCDAAGPDQHKICKCKLHRLYPGETCFAHEECKPKSCVAKGEIPVCSGHPQVCKCKPEPQGKDQCVEDADCPACDKEDETSRCAGTPKVCKPCEFRYLSVGEKCTDTKECLYCADKEDEAKCRLPLSGEAKETICKCKDHRFPAGHQCLAHEDCKCEDSKDVAGCSGHPRVCKCEERSSKQVGERCDRGAECKPCVDPADKPFCSHPGPLEHHICMCKLHRLYVGEKCHGAEECKPKPCLAEGKHVECKETCQCHSKSFLETILGKL